MPHFKREDWTLFRSLGTISQKAGVPTWQLRRLVLKELADNALDAAGNCRVGESDGASFYFVQDDGPGLPGEPADVAELFSIGRPLTSSKLLRLPTRGAVGNGLRVVAGTVLASGGRLTVYTQNRKHRLTPKDDGTTAVEWEAADFPTGTRVEIRFGGALDEDDDDALAWARMAVELGSDNAYRGKPSGWWYDSESFHELCLSAGEMTVRELVAEIDGCAGAKAGELAGDFKGRRANELSRDESTALLRAIRAASKPVDLKRLGSLGKSATEGAYACERGTFRLRPGRTGLAAEIPFIVEAWAKPRTDPALGICINRTPVASELAVYRHPNSKGDYTVNGFGLLNGFPVGRRGDFALTINVTAPYVPITNDGKTPDLSVIRKPLLDAMEKAVKRAKRTGKSETSGKPHAQNAFIRSRLDAAIQHAGGHVGRYSQRQLFYAMRKIHEEVGAACEVPKWDYFCKVITAIEAERGSDLPRMTRDDRGILYHPHLREHVPLGTRSVEVYRRPEWLFHKVLYIEKEGFVDALVDAGWPERNDCALLTSKGQPTRAARDLLDLLGDTDEPLTFYAVHDADAYGTGIYQALTQATLARPARRVEVVNLGLEPAEALDMGLQIEPAEASDRKHPVADYVVGEWREWYQSHRVELNSMTTPEFIDWLDGKLRDYGPTKLVPPATVLKARLLVSAEQLICKRLADEAIAAARVHERAEAAVDALLPHVAAMDPDLVPTVRLALDEQPAHPWTLPVETLAAALLESKNGQN